MTCLVQHDTRGTGPWALAFGSWWFVGGSQNLAPVSVLLFYDETAIDILNCDCVFLLFFSFLFFSLVFGSLIVLHVERR